MTFEKVREKYKIAQAERERELEQERKLMTHDKKEHINGSDSDPLVKRREKKQQTVEEANKIIELRRKKLRNMLKQNQADEITAKGNREKHFEPTTQRLDKVEKAVKLMKI
jgi:hypothetical protein